MTLSYDSFCELGLRSQRDAGIGMSGFRTDSSGTSCFDFAVLPLTEVGVPPEAPPLVAKDLDLGPVQ